MLALIDLALACTDAAPQAEFWKKDVGYAETPPPLHDAGRVHQGPRSTADVDTRGRSGAAVSAPRDTR